MSWGTATTGPNVHRIPVAFISRAVALQTCSTRAGSFAAPRPTFCGKIVAPSTLFDRAPHRRRRGSGCRGGSRGRPAGRRRPCRTRPWGVGRRESAAATEDRAQRERAGIRRVDRVLLDLGHLADLLVDGHLAQQRRHPVSDGQGRIHPRTPGGRRPGQRRGRRRARGTGRARRDGAAAGSDEGRERYRAKATHRYSSRHRRACSIAQIASGRRYMAAR